MSTCGCAGLWTSRCSVGVGCGAGLIASNAPVAGLGRRKSRMPEQPTRLSSSVAEVHGTALQGYERVRAAFEANLASGQEIGASFSVYRDGPPVVDRRGAHLRTREQ